ncbi:phosphatase PAP2 family protein [Micromonospora sp. NPDC049559]|uniref:phosphatase PAP2 family protein n=1 Tax=Micromonospora sp. NPDC049559 TaxID=3155923 RepID=UPI00341DAD79
MAPEDLPGSVRNSATTGVDGWLAGSWRSRLVLALACLLIGAGLLTMLAPAGLGGPTPLRVTQGPSAAGYRLVAETAGKAPGFAHDLVELATEGTLLLLLLLVAGVWLLGRVRDPRMVGGALLTMVGTAVAYATSEGLKALVDEERPCRALGAVHTIATCPPVGDWSFPSNHSTIGGALAVGLALTVRRLAPVVLPLGVLAALLRVVAGVHYPHDITAGLALGGTVTAASLLAGMPAAVRLVGLVRQVPVLGPALAGRP